VIFLINCISIIDKQELEHEHGLHEQ